MKITYADKYENIHLNNKALKKVLPHTVHLEPLTAYVSSDLPTPELPFTDDYRKSIWLNNTNGSYVELRVPLFYPNAIVFGRTLISDTNNEVEMQIQPATILDVTIPEAVLRKMKEVIDRVVSVRICRTYSMFHIQLVGERESWLYNSSINFGTLLGDFSDVYRDDDMRAIYNALDYTNGRQGAPSFWDVEPNQWVTNEVGGSVIHVYREPIARKG